MKSREGNVFIGICPSIILSTGGYVTSNASWDRSHGRVHPPQDIRPGDLPPPPPPTLDLGTYPPAPEHLSSCENGSATHLAP